MDVSDDTFATSGFAVAAVGAHPAGHRAAQLDGHGRVVGRLEAGGSGRESGGMSEAIYATISHTKRHYIAL